MNTEITLTLSPDNYQRAKELAMLTERSVNDLLSESIKNLLSPLATSSSVTKPVSALSDEEVLALRKLELSQKEDNRLSLLLNIQQAGNLTTKESAELFALMQVYQDGLLRKARALNEAVKRGLMEPLSV